MKKSKYHQFLQRFLSQLRKEYNLQKEEFTLFEIVNIKFHDYQYQYRAKVILGYLIFFSAIVFSFLVFELQSPSRYIALFSLLPTLIIFILAFPYFSMAAYFTRLHSRIKNIENMLASTTEPSLEDLIDLIESHQPIYLTGEKMAIQAYYEFKMNHAPKNPKQEYSPIERLTILFIILNEEFEYKTNDAEFNTLLGALLNISPNRLEKEYRSFLNRLSTFMRNKNRRKLSSAEIEEIKNTLISIKSKLDVNSLLSNLIEHNYQPSIFPVRNN